MSFKMRLFLVVMIVMIMFLLHNSFWLWRFDGIIPLLFGFMPFAFFYYVGYTLLAVLAMRIIITLGWPDPPDDLFAAGVEEERSEK